jgi:transcriptional regulator with XRE-family HTH domain
MNTLSDRLRWAMVKAGLTQAQLAGACGVSTTAIGKLARGEASSSKHIVKIALALNVSPFWLVSGAADPLRPADSAVSDSAGSYGGVNHAKKLIIDKMDMLTREQIAEIVKQIDQIIDRNKRLIDELGGIYGHKKGGTDEDLTTPKERR